MSTGKVFSFNMFTLHIHKDPGEIIEEFDYDLFFDFLTEIRDTVEKRKVVTAIAESYRTDEAIVLKFVSGERDEPVLEYKINGKLTEILPSKGSAFVNDTYIIFFNGTRQLAVQNTRPGLTKDNLQYALESYLKLFTKNQYSTVFMQPVYSADFINEVDKLTRIQSARITLRLPNPSFLDSQQQLMADIAHESNAQKQEIKLTAPRGKSLEKDSGIVKIIKEASVSNPRGVDSFSVRGKHPDSVKMENINSDEFLAKSSDKIFYKKDSGNFISSLVNISKKLLNHAQANI
ncbi:hypothetical protein [Rothia sp. P4278]|uniref:hypothetical protein n=1 Tax=Rothia sp. P4278 TaxID=3402658 RepID=UPI003ADDD761